MKTAFLTAGILIGLGILIFTVTLACNDWDIKRLGTVRYETVEQTIDADFTDISIDAISANVTLLPSEDGGCRLVLRQNVRIRHTVSVDEEGKLSIKAVDRRRWYDHISFSFTSPSITLYLPKEEYGRLAFRISTGDIKLSEGLAFSDLAAAGSTGDLTCLSAVRKSLEVKVSTGDIHIDGAAPKSVSLTASTGDIRLSAVSAETLTVKTSTGKVSIKGSAVSGAAELQSSTGDVSLTDTSLGSLTVKVTTGDVRLTAVTASARLSVTTSTGDVRLTDSDAAELSLTASTGDVNASLLTPKTVLASSDTGRIRVPDGTVGGICKIKTETGNITVSFKAQ